MILYSFSLPNDSRNSIEIEGCLPGYVVSEETRQWHSYDDSRVSTAEGKRCQSRSFHGRCPHTPDPVARGISYTLKNIFSKQKFKLQTKKDVLDDTYVMGEDIEFGSSAVKKLNGTSYKPS